MKIGGVLILSIYVSFAIADSAYGQTARIDSGLVGYWSFDEGNGTVAYDSSGSGNNGTIQGASWTEGVLGSALYFDGTDDYVEVAHDDRQDPGEELSLAAWVKLDDANNDQKIIGRAIRLEAEKIVPCLLMLSRQRKNFRILAT